MARKRYKPNFNVMTGVGRAKYVVNYHDGKKTHSDGSPFYDIHISRNKRDHENFIRGLRNQGYTEGNNNGLALSVG
ncbi:MAG: hypothetical protein IJS13_06880 [Paludibacteraceae bacterium]|nr:hypothetical protein [Paludibacteraceae bacterium]